ncbi:phosphotransferase [Dactylosporangium sp. NPDC049525]|uniref:phosphotransferase n=1 Tax=Dactylosporangium sp. NPDC049525 TaxID=3154730 RepID=UPI00343D9871
MTDWPELPDGVAESIEKRWPGRAQPWAEQVEVELRLVCGAHNAVPRHVLPSRFGFVVAADSPRGGLVVRSSPDPDALLQAEVALSLAKLGIAPRVHETIASDVGLWTVMDEVRPGTPLALTDRNTVNLRMLAAPFAKMCGQPAPHVDMPSIFDWLRDRLEDDNLIDVPVYQDGPAPLGERQAALRTLDELASTAEPSLCHGDASTWNLLISSEGQWVLVDPRGVSGEPDYDLAVIALKLRSDLVPEQAARRLAGAAEVDSQRVLSWLAVAEAARV